MLVLLVTIHLALCSFFVFTPKMLGILVGMYQKDSCAVHRSLAGRRHSTRDTEAVPHGPYDHRDSRVRGYGGRFPCCAGRADFAVVVQRHIPVVRLRLTTEISQLLHKVIDVPVCRSSRFTSPSWRRGSFPWSKLFVGPKASPVAEHGGQCPCCAVLQVLQFSRADVERQPSSHSCTRRFRAWTRSFTRPLCATTGAGCFGAQKTALVLLWRHEVDQLMAVMS